MENHIIIDNRNKPLVTNHVQNRDGYQNNGYENYNKQNSGSGATQEMEFSIQDFFP